MKILVTGGSGFIGSHLVKELEAQGHTVNILSNIAPNITKKQNYIFADITNRETMLKVIPKYEVVYHLAGLLGTSELIEKAYEASRVNILGTINILDGALINKTKIIHITKPNCWLNTYSITKYTGESFVKMYKREFGLPAVSIRWYNVYGPNQSFHCQKAAPFFIRWALKNEPIQIWGNGKQTMDLIYVTDAVRATIEIGNQKKYDGMTIDVGSGKETSVNTLAEMVIKLTNSKSRILHLPMRPGEDTNTKLCADTSIIKDLGFKFKYDLETGMKKTVEWYIKHL
jgi:UDP-glucose 4-epimerase